MALVKEFSKPDIFLTMTCNPNWKEIKAELLPKQTWQDRPDLVARVFRAKLEQLKEDLLKKEIFGPVQAHVYVVEFQKRGLPHVHFLLIKNTKAVDAYEVFPCSHCNNEDRTGIHKARYEVEVNDGSHSFVAQIFGKLAENHFKIPVTKVLEDEENAGFFDFKKYESFSSKDYYNVQIKITASEYRRGVKRYSVINIQSLDARSPDKESDSVASASLTESSAFRTPPRMPKSDSLEKGDTHEHEQIACSTETTEVDDVVIQAVVSPSNIQVVTGLEQQK